MEFDVIHSYTRKQALEDGVLVDLNRFEVCRHHYKHPIACTDTVWAIIEQSVRNKKHCNDYQGILHDMLWMSRVCRRVIDASTVIFTVIITGAGRGRNHEFKMVCGPDDDGAPCLTIMLPNED